MHPQRLAALFALVLTTASALIVLVQTSPAQAITHLPATAATDEFARPPDTPKQESEIPDIWISEVHPDAEQSGNDSAYEWFELTNAGDQPIDLTGWTIADSQAEDPLDGIIIQPGTSLAIGASIEAGAGIEVIIDDGRIGNGLANSGDRLSLRNPSDEDVSAVSWGKDREFATIGKPKPGQSIHRPARDADVFLASPSPGALTPPPPTEQPTDDAAPPTPPAKQPAAETPVDAAPPSQEAEPPDIWISEVYPNAKEGNGGYAHEWFELTNAGDQPVDLTDWIIEDNNSKDALDGITIQPNTSLAIGPLTEVETSIEVTIASKRIGGGLANDGDQLRLISPDGTVVSGISWGDNQEFTTIDGPTSEQSIHRPARDADVFLAPPSPGNLTLTPPAPPAEQPTESAPPSPTPPVEQPSDAAPQPSAPTAEMPLPDTPPQDYEALDIWISEVYPDAGQGRNDHTYEWFELTNASDQPIDLTGWIIADGQADDSLDGIVVPPDTSIAIGASTEVGSGIEAVIADGRIGNGLANSGDQLHLISPDSTVVSGISWGDNQEFATIDGPTSEQSVHRPARDTDVFLAPPSPGVLTLTPPAPPAEQPTEPETPTTTPPAEQPADAAPQPPAPTAEMPLPDTPSEAETPDIWISEVYPNAKEGNGGYAHEWFELTNAGDQPVDLTGWIIEDNNSKDDLDGITIQPNTSLAIGTSAKAGTGIEVVTTDDGRIGNGLNNDGDRLSLRNPDDEVVSSISWGTDQEFDTIGKPTSEQSIHRPVRDADVFLAPPSPGTLTLIAPPPPSIEQPADAAVQPSAPAAETRSDTVPPPLRITEILPAPFSGQAEWVEIFNPTDQPVNLDGWSIADANRATELTGEIAPRARFIIATRPLDYGEAHLLVDRIGNGLNNSGDTVRLLSPDDAVVHEVTYGSDALPAPKRGLSIALVGDRWVVTAEPTPGGEGVAPLLNNAFSTAAARQPASTNTKHTPSPVTPPQGYAALDIWISEVYPNAGQGRNDHTYEWFELTNAGAQPINLAGWSIADKQSEDALDGVVVPAGASIVIGTSATAGSNVRAVISDGRIGNGLANSSDQLRLVSPDGAEISGISWGGNSTFATTGSPTPEQSIHRPGRGASVFLAPTSPGVLTRTAPLTTPAEQQVETAEQLFSPRAETATYAALLLQKLDAPDIWISEVYPDAGQGGSDYAYEWFELTNDSDQSIDLTGWTIADGHSEDSLDGIVIQPDTSLVIGASTEAGPDIATAIADGRIGNGLANSGDQLRLISPDGSEISGISWGSNREFAAIDSPTPEQSVHRPARDAGAFLAPPSPGILTLTAQPTLEEPPADAAAESSATSAETAADAAPPPLRITELMPAPLSGQAEWVELFNPTEQPVNLDGWSLADTDRATELSGEIAPRARFIIATRPLDYGEAHLLVDRIGNGLNNSGDTVRLLSPDDAAVHEVTYGSAALPAPERGLSIALEPDRWVITAEPTPGGEDVTPLLDDAFSIAATRQPISDTRLPVTAATAEQGSDAWMIVSIALIGVIITLAMRRWRPVEAVDEPSADPASEPVRYTPGNGGS